MYWGLSKSCLVGKAYGLGNSKPRPGIPALNKRSQPGKYTRDLAYMYKPTVERGMHKRPSHGVPVEFCHIAQPGRYKTPTNSRNSYHTEDS